MSTIFACPRPRYMPAPSIHLYSPPHPLPALRKGEPTQANPGGCHPCHPSPSLARKGGWDPFSTKQAGGNGLMLSFTGQATKWRRPGREQPPQSDSCYPSERTTERIATTFPPTLSFAPIGTPFPFRGQTRHPGFSSLPMEWGPFTCPGQQPICCRHPWPSIWTQPTLYRCF